MSALDMEQLYREYHGKVMRYIYARVQSWADTEDLCADVFEKAQRNAASYDGQRASPGTWIFAITRNSVIDYFRRSHPSEELDENLTDESEVDERLLSQETLSELARALQKLPEELRSIIVLRYYDGKPLTEIAAMMRLSYGAVKLRHQSALNLLRKELHGLIPQP